MVEMVAEILVDLLAEVFFESDMGFSSSRYVPRWLRLLFVTFIAGLLMLLVYCVAYSPEGDNTAFFVFGALVSVFWIFMVIRVMRIKNQKYVYARLENGQEFTGIRHMIWGGITGMVQAAAIKPYVQNENGVKVEFSKSDEFHSRKDRVARLEAKEIAFLNSFSVITEDEFRYIYTKARHILQEKLKGKLAENTGSGLRLKRVIFEEKPDGSIDIYYRFKDKVSGKYATYVETKQ